MFAKLIRLLRRSRFEENLDAEVRDHMAKYTDDLVAQGVPREEAEWRARREFGFVSQIKEDVRLASGVAWADTLMRHLRFGLRLLRRNPAFALTSIATLALTIGANTAIFSIVDAMLYRPLPYPQPERFGQVINHVRDGKGAEFEQTAVNGTQWEFVRDRTRAVDVALHRGPEGVNLVTQGVAQFVRQMRVSAGFFAVLGVAPQIGREFTREEDVPGGPPLVVLGHSLWERQFGADASVVGQTILLRGEPYSVIGVMPAGFASAPPADLWTPLRPSTRGEGSGLNYTLLGRVRSGFTAAQATAELGVLGDAFLTRPGSKAGKGVQLQMRLMPVQTAYGQAYRDQMLLLWAAVGAVLLIGCVNIAGMMLARGAARRHEIATRLALGCGRGGIAAQMLSESLLLAALGGVIGLALGYAAIEALRPTLTAVLQPAQAITIDLRVLALAIATTLLTSLLFGLYPALQASRADLRTAMGDSGRTATARTGKWARRVLVVVEVALGMVLLVGAGLVVRTLAHLNGLTPGFDPSNVLTATVSLRDARYATQEPVLNLYDRSIERLLATPGVEAAGVALSVPYDRALNTGARVLDGPSAGERQEITNYTYGTPGYFEALRFRLAAGRWFDGRDRSGAPAVALINEAFARYFFRDDNPLGRHILLDGETREVVGVVGDVLQRSGWGDFGPAGAARSAYAPAAQIEGNGFGALHGFYSPQWVVRSAGSMTRLPQTVRGAIAAVDPQLPVAEFRTMEQVRDGAFSVQRLESAMLAALAGLALLLAGVGIYGLIAQSVVARRREFGIRLALGCSRSSAVAKSAGTGIVLAAAGLVIGTYLSIQAARLIESMLFGVKANDTATFVTVAAALLLVAILASFLPSAKIARIDPARTLREE